MRTLTIAELVGAVGLDLGHTAWVTVDQTRVDTFADVTEDHQWIHVDPELARTGPFGTTIAHGYLTLSLVSKFLLDLIEVPDAASAINYGLDRVRFPAPVPVGSRVRGHGEIVSVTPLDGGVQITTQVTVECDAGAKPAAIAQVLTRFVGARPT